MYQYDDFDKDFIQQRARQFRNQVNRRLTGQLTEDEFKPLRLQNGLYLQLHAYMVRVAIPYGILSSDQLIGLADIADRFDRGYGHFTTRQNIQFNWVTLRDMPDLLDALSEIDMHAVQTSGNCIRNITSDPFAGVAADENIDPRPYCEALRQWSTAHPEFAFLPRKFKFAITGSKQDRAAIKVHDIGLRIHKDQDGEPRFEIWVGGGQGRTPKIAHLMFEDVPQDKLLAMLESIMRVYNLEGRRDNKYKARIKILVNAMGLDRFREEVLSDLQHNGANAPVLTTQQIEGIAARFLVPDYMHADQSADKTVSVSHSTSSWRKRNVYSHKHSDHRIVVVSLKPKGGIPGDATSLQMRQMAAIADRFSHGELRVTKNQNLVLPHVAENQLDALYESLQDSGMHTANVGLLSDITACPGLDYCGLATARSIPLAQTLGQNLIQSQAEQLSGDFKINISGCINACGHHHVADIGILGMDKKDQEFYQVSIGGRDDQNAAIGQILGPGFSAAEIPQVVERLVAIYLQHRLTDESFSHAVNRLGHNFFKEQIYVDTAA